MRFEHFCGDRVEAVNSREIIRRLRIGEDDRGLKLVGLECVEEEWIWAPQGCRTRSGGELRWWSSVSVFEGVVEDEMGSDRLRL